MNKIFYYIIFILIIFTTAAFSESEVVMDSAFFKKFSSMNLISRDEYLEDYLNNIVIGKGKVISVSESGRYKKKYRAVIESADSGSYNQKFVFYLFFDIKTTADLLSVDTVYEFKGQFMGYSPLNTKRNGYIIDAVLMDVSTVIE